MKDIWLAFISGIVVLSAMAIGLVAFVSDYETPPPEEHTVAPRERETPEAENEPRNPPSGLASVEVSEEEAGGYSREAFGDDWAGGTCDTRDEVMSRDLEVHETASDGCSVVSGTLDDPYTGSRMEYSSSDPMSVQVDHVVPLAEAWRHGASEWSDSKREEFYNDTSNLLAVNGSVNQEKGDSSPSEWMPSFDQCRYARIYVETLQEYDLTVNQADRDALESALAQC